MEERISLINKIGLKKDDVLSMVMFDRGLSGADLNFLEDEFDFSKADIDNFLSCYKNVGMVFKLNKANTEYSSDWKLFVLKVIKKSYEFDKFNNIFVSKKFDKVLLVTNKRLLKVDLGILNEKIDEINYRISNYDEKVQVEMEAVAEATKDEHTGFLGKVIGVLKR